jgi:cytochrome c-type biogenesis protein
MRAGCEDKATMNQWLEAFVLGNGAILTNVCVLPLYPGLIAFLAGTASGERGGPAVRWAGVLVLSGVLTLMTLAGMLLYGLQRSVGDVLPVLLPLIYGVVIVLGVLMLLGRNPFQRLATAQAPVLRNPYLTAYVYGLMLGPMTLPCVGPLVVSVFLLGAGNVADLTGSLFYFWAFGLGFGWPLVVLPFLAQPLQTLLTRRLTASYGLLTRLSGILLVVIGLFGIWVDLLPNL